MLICDDPDVHTVHKDTGTHTENQEKYRNIYIHSHTALCEQHAKSSLLTLPLPNVLQPCPHQCPLLHSLPLCLPSIMSLLPPSHFLCHAFFSPHPLLHFLSISLLLLLYLLSSLFSLETLEREKREKWENRHNGARGGCGLWDLCLCQPAYLLVLCCMAQVFFVLCLWVCLLLFVPVCLYCSTSLRADQQA